jgi:hypothetical protein
MTRKKTVKTLTGFLKFAIRLNHGCTRHPLQAKYSWKPKMKPHGKEVERHTHRLYLEAVAKYWQKVMRF